MLDEPTDTNDIAYDANSDQLAANFADSSTIERLTRLEIQASFTEDLVDRLDLIITRQQSQIDQLTREVQRMRQTSSAESLPAQGNLRDDLPPHY
jgi:SlyX protein